MARSVCRSVSFVRNYSVLWFPLFSHCNSAVFLSFSFFFSLGGALISVLGNVFFLAAEWRLVNLRAAFRLRKLQ